jgi:N-acetylmuramoyl-L-alanine amidase
MTTRIAVFAGHVGKDPGAISPPDPAKNDQLYTVEAVVTWGVASRLFRYLAEMGIEYTPIIGGFQDRLAASAGCTLGVELHADSCAEPERHGYHVLYNKGSAEGLRLAQRIDESLLYHAQRARAPHCDENLFMLRETPFPCVIVELGFLTNPSEESWLMRDGAQYRLAFGVADGLVRYVYNGGAKG